MTPLGNTGTPIRYLAREVKDLNLDLAERNLLSLSYGRIIPKDIDSNEGLLPASFERYTKVRPGDTVLRLTDLQNDQRSLRTGLVQRPGMITSAYLTLRPNPQTDARFFAYTMHAIDVNKTFYALGGGLRQSMGMEDVSNLRLRLPGLTEQRRIADFLDDHVARIEGIVAARAEQRLLLASAKNRLVLDRLLAGGELTGLQKEPFRALPDTWTVQRLANTWTVIDCKHRTPEYTEVGYPVVSPGDVRPGRLDLTGCTRFVSDADYADLADDLRRCNPGDLVYSRNASAGVGALVMPGQQFTMGQDVCRITSTNADQGYLGHVLNYAVAPQLEAMRIGSTITRINITAIKSLMVPVPPLREQAEITERVWLALDVGASAAGLLQRSIDLMTEYKRSLITAAVTGELDVTTARSGVVE